MITPLYTQEEFIEAKSRDKLMLCCEVCGNPFPMNKHHIQKSIKNGSSKGSTCSKECKHKLRCHRNPPIKTNCSHCNTEIFVHQRVVNKSKTKRFFCSQSHSATYNMTHKTKGTRISKLEVWLSKQLTVLYLDIEFHFNRKDAINSELDIYLPKYKLAFELNGIFHYEPIYGDKKFDQIKNNDNRKFQACIEHGIELCIIDTSKMTYLKEEKAKPFLTIITNIINTKL